MVKTLPPDVKAWTLCIFHATETLVLSGAQRYLVSPCSWLSPDQLGTTWICGNLPRKTRAFVSGSTYVLT